MTTSMRPNSTAMTENSSQQDLMPISSPPNRPYGVQTQCQICSSIPLSPVPLYHRHFSSLYLRKILGVETSNVPFMCPSCMLVHQPYPSSRLKIVVSDRTLHEFFAPRDNADSRQYTGDSLHIDYITIDGADIRTLTYAFRNEYMTSRPTKPMDVVLVGGYADLVRGYDRNYIIEKLHRFAHLVMKKTRDENLPREAGDSIAIASLAYPPQLAWMPDNGQLPYQGYRNNLEKIDWLNSRIRQLNSDYNSLNPPCFHTYGVRKSTRTKVDRFGQVSVTPSWLHRWDHWLVSDPAEMLHLTNERRIKMGVAINNYFKINTLN